MKFGDPWLNRFREIRPKAVGKGISDSFSRLEVANIVFDSVTEDEIGVEASVKHGDF